MEPQATTVSGVAGWLPYLTPAQRGTIGCNSLPFVCPSARPSHTCRPVRVRVSLNPRPCNTSITPEACVSSDGIRTHTCASLPSTEGKSPMTTTTMMKIPVACVNEERRSSKRENCISFNIPIIILLTGFL